MSKYSEIKNDFYDENEHKVYIDAWFTGDDNEEGNVIAKVDIRTNEVEYLDDDAKTDPYAQEIIKDTIDNAIETVIIRDDIIDLCYDSIDFWEQLKAEIKEIPRYDALAAVEKWKSFFIEHNDMVKNLVKVKARIDAIVEHESKNN